MHREPNAAEHVGAVFLVALLAAWIVLPTVYGAIWIAADPFNLQAWACALAWPIVFGLGALSTHG